MEEKAEKQKIMICITRNGKYFILYVSEEAFSRNMNLDWILDIEEVK